MEGSPSPWHPPDRLHEEVIPVGGDQVGRMNRDDPATDRHSCLGNRSRPRDGHGASRGNDVFEDDLGVCAVAREVMEAADSDIARTGGPPKMILTL
jgi:hypothetical protein